MTDINLVVDAGTEVDFSYKDDGLYDIDLDQKVVMVEGTPYTGSYQITPSAETQTLQTSGLLMTNDVVVNPIPSNYGLITWNGSTLTVS